MSFQKRHPPIWVRFEFAEEAEICLIHIFSKRSLVFFFFFFHRSRITLEALCISHIRKMILQIGPSLYFGERSVRLHKEIGHPRVFSSGVHRHEENRQERYHTTSIGTMCPFHKYANEKKENSPSSIVCLTS